MASVFNLRGINVAIAYVDALGSLTPMRSSRIGGTWNTTHHAIEVRDGMRFAVQLTFDLYSLGASMAEYIEVAIRFDGFVVAHNHIPVTDIRAGGGVYNFLTFADGMTGVGMTAEFRALATSISKYPSLRQDRFLTDARSELGRGRPSTCAVRRRDSG